MGGSQNGEMPQPSRLPGGGSEEMDDYGDENDGRAEGEMGQSMGEDEPPDDILAGYGQEDNENDEEGPSMEDLNQEELEAIIESITSGKSQSFKKL